MDSTVATDSPREMELYSKYDTQEEHGKTEMQLNSGDDNEQHDDESEPIVDLRGYKHCNIYNPYYYGYSTPYDTDTSHRTFSMPGQAGANTLRAYLHDNLQPQLVMNEYGEHCDIADISNGHLATLQAKLWSGTLATPSPATAPDGPSRAEKLVLEHVLTVGELLRGKFSRTSIRTAI